MATPIRIWQHPFWAMGIPRSPAHLTSFRKSEYIRNFSNSNNILASRLHCRCSGWAWTILCSARPAFRRISGGWGLALPEWRILTKMSTTWCCLIMVQLLGLEDMAKKVLDILSMSLLPSRDTSESTHSILVSMSSERWWRKLTSLFKECTEDVKLITEADSSWNKKDNLDISQCLIITQNVAFWIFSSGAKESEGRLSEANLKIIFVVFWHFPSFFVLFKVTCLVMLFDCKL